MRGTQERDSRVMKGGRRIAFLAFFTPIFVPLHLTSLLATIAVTVAVLACSLHVAVRDLSQLFPSAYLRCILIKLVCDRLCRDVRRK